ncbi:MAG: F0F1 ATP synthase subunit delta [Campylobacterales bacterium]|nr:F0F1 ATP synthase subunit delta [Campylobacterales bacterium]
MEELIAKRYIKAFDFNSDLASMENLAEIFSVLAESFKNERYNAIFNNPSVSSDDKSSILLDAVKSANSNEVNNMIKLLVENKRIGIIPAISVELQKEISRKKKSYTGVVFSDTQISDATLNELSSNLGNRFESTIVLDFVQSNYNGIKVEVEGLGIEIDFSKDRIDRQVIEHIIKAI